MSAFSPKRDVPLLLAAIVAGVYFFLSLDRLWPLARIDLDVPRANRIEQARAFLIERGFSLDGYRASTLLSLDSDALEYAEREFGKERAQGWIGDGRPIYRYRVYFKHRGETTTYTVELHPEAGITGWRRTLEEDEPGARLAVDAARALALEAMRDGLALDPAGWEEKAVSTAELPERTDHRFTFERHLSDEPELRERLFVGVAGDRVVSAQPLLVVPPEAARQARAAEAPGRTLETIGFALLAAAAIGAFFVFLTRLRDGTVLLGRALIWPGVILICLLGTYALQTGILFLNWEPLWPRWVSTLQYLVYRAMEEVWMLLALLAVIAAGDALDRESGGGRGASLWALARGRLLDPAVGLASLRGFLVGMLCGATMALAVLLLQAVAAAPVSIQPRGFFFYPINAASPAWISLLFFLNVALLEELGYRFFAGTWLEWLTRRRWLAIVVPAVIYGLTHTRLDFLPPAEPFWGRAVVLTLVGCVWGWAFFRYDALTVVLSHYTADLFIFNWPRLGSGEPLPTAVAAATVAVPLVPALLWTAGRGLGPLLRRRA